MCNEIIKYKAYIPELNKVLPVKFLDFHRDLESKPREFNGKVDVYVFVNETDTGLWVFPEYCKLLKYTGKKDREDKEIYQGDIISYNWNITENSSDQYAKVIYSEEFSCFGIKWLGDVHPDDIGFKPLVNTEYHDLELEWDLSKFKVVGNIYENSGLFGVV
jgi:uncharacterized phage protein (TIGR01671 family)